MTEQTHTQSIEACSEKTGPSNLIQDRLRTKLKKYLEELKKKKIHIHQHKIHNWHPVRNCKQAQMYDA